MSATEIPAIPRLRPVEAFPVRMNKQDLICLRDPESLAEQPLFLNQALVFLISRMDGEHSLRDIQADFFRATGKILPMEDIEALVRQLDERHYLDSDSFQAYFQALVREFQSTPTRPAIHAGSAYEEDPEKLLSQIRGYFSAPEGPGTGSTHCPSKPLRGLVAPHIDFIRGGPTYAHAYKALLDHPGARTFVIFGTCHSPMAQRFSIGTKDYDTPLGPAKIDGDFAARLTRRLNGRYMEEFCHRREHSIEFQAVFLKYIFGASGHFRIIPILVQSFHDVCASGKPASENPEISEMVEAVRETARETAGTVCFIAGADLAHVGRRFGDPSGPTPLSLQEVGLEDRAFLKLVETGNAEGIIHSIARDNDSRRICGYPPIYMTLRCIDNPEGSLLDYRQWSDLKEGAAVTYSALSIL
jgi:AmmeMemoRadiSam system protein B